MLLVLFCIHVNHLCTLYLYSFLAVVYRGPHGRLAFFSLNVLPSENKDYYYYHYYFYIIIILLLIYKKEWSGGLPVTDNCPSFNKKEWE